MCVATAFAQNNNSDPKAAEVEVEFSVYASQPQLMKRIFVMDPDLGPKEVSFRKGGTFPVYHYKGPQVITFFDYVGTYGDKEGGFRVIPKAQVQIPQGAERILLFFAPKRDGESGLPFRVMVMPFDEKAFPYQSAMIFNGSGQNLWMNTGAQMISLRSGPSGVFGMRDGKGNFQFYYEVGGKRLLAFNQTYACAEDERIFILILPSLNKRNPGDVRVEFFKENKPKIPVPSAEKQQQSDDKKRVPAKLGPSGK
jgi:hypothetical protein